MIITCALKLMHSLAGSFFMSETTCPLLTSSYFICFTLNPTISPVNASCEGSKYISKEPTSDYRSVGAIYTVIPTFKTPVSIRPTGTVPTPPIL